MRILLTGSTGFVARNILDAFAGSAHEIVCAPPATETFTSRDDAYRFIARLNLDLIIHAAGRVGGIQANIDAPFAFLVDNAIVGLQLVDAARASGVPRFLNLASSCIYPVDTPQPFREQDLTFGRLEPTNEAYAIAKLAVARACQYAGRDDGLAYKTLVPPGIYGRYDHSDASNAHLIGAVIRRLDEAKIAGVESVPIWGDGTARREFLFAGDLADCIVRAVGHFDTLPEVMNVSAGFDLSVTEWCHSIADAVGYRGGFHFDPSFPQGAQRKLLDGSLAEAWGWRATTDLGAGLAAAYEWWRESKGAREARN